MVFQMPYLDKQHAFVGSSAPSEELAQFELAEWAGGNGFQPASLDRTFVTYHSGEAREWVLMERAEKYLCADG